MSAFSTFIATFIIRFQSIDGQLVILRFVVYRNVFPFLCVGSLSDMSTNRIYMLLDLRMKSMGNMSIYVFLCLCVYLNKMNKRGNNTEAIRRFDLLN